jgi:hypothetical protein
MANSSHWGIFLMFLKQFSQVGGLVVIIHKRNEPNLAIEARQDG